MAYMLQLELNLKHAAERIRSLETEIRTLRAELIVTDGCMLPQALLDPADMGFHDD